MTSCWQNCWIAGERCEPEPGWCCRNFLSGWWNTLAWWSLGMEWNFNRALCDSVFNFKRCLIFICQGLWRLQCRVLPRWLRALWVSPPREGESTKKINKLTLWLIEYTANTCLWQKVIHMAKCAQRWETDCCKVSPISIIFPITPREDVTKKVSSSILKYFSKDQIELSWCSWDLVRKKVTELTLVAWSEVALVGGG